MALVKHSLTPRISACFYWLQDAAKEVTMPMDSMTTYASHGGRPLASFQKFVAFWRCSHCGFEWMARTNKPRQCGRCWSRDWDNPSAVRQPHFARRVKLVAPVPLKRFKPELAVRLREPIRGTTRRKPGIGVADLQKTEELRALLAVLGSKK